MAKLSKSETLKNPEKNSKKNAAKNNKKPRKSGPRLPSSLIKEIDNRNLKNLDSEGEEDEYDAKVSKDLYEYEEEIPEEETKMNRRYDSVENYEYELPEDFEDEDVPSDEDEDIKSDGTDGDDEEDEGDKHLRMLEGITGIRGKAFDVEEENQTPLTDFQGNLNDGKLSISDLLDPLHGKAGYSKLRKRVQQIERKPMALHAPLPKVHRERMERQVAYEHSKKDITKWEPLVKRNREAPTLYFEEDVNLGLPTIGAIASEFQPMTDFEKKMAALVRDPEVAEAHWKDGAKLLELNKVSIKDVRERQNRLAKMRSFLFRHEMKAKHIKKIKSKTYHRILKKEKHKAASSGMEVDSEAAKELARKQEFKRAEERMTLKHKNSSKWAQRIIKRGLHTQDENTIAAISNQLNQHALLTRKQNSVNDDSSSAESNDDEDDELSSGGERDKISKLLNRAKDKTLKVMEKDGEDCEVKSGVFALPFMERGLKKRKEAAEEEARIALEEYQSSLGRLENDGEAEQSKSDIPSGRKVFGAAKKQPEQPSKRIKLDDTRNSDSEDDFAHREHEDDHEEENETDDIKLGSSLLDEDLDMGQKAVFKNFDDIVKDPGPKTTYDVAIFASGSWKKMKDEKKMKECSKKSESNTGPNQHSYDVKEMDQINESDSEEEMVEGYPSIGSKNDYELPSQAELIHDAFAADDVAAEFEKDKMEVLNEENPEPEKPSLIPGWGQWTNIQLKRGPPSWMIEEHERAQRKRDEALKKRKDYKFKNVIISEKIDKKAQKLMTKNLPFPYKSKDAYEQSIRMPLGPEYNPAISIGALNRPSVVKKTGVIIKPIKYEDVDPYGKDGESSKHSGDKAKIKKTKNTRGKPPKKKA